MKLQVLLIAGLALCVAACAGGGGTAPEAADQMQIEPRTAAGRTGPQSHDLPSESFIAHMHLHADQLDKINYALADDDLYGAMTPAYWLSRHEDVSGVPAEWQPYMIGMRKEAFAVENANELSEARAAARRLNENCQGCHAVAGVR